MSSKTKIVVLHMKEVIYTVIFLILAVILGLVVFFMFGSGKASATSGEIHKYQPGIYTSSISLNNNTFDVEVTVDADQITAIHLTNLSESTAAMFPLMEPALASLASQIYSSQSLDQIVYSDDQKYTSLLLLNSIREALDKAELH
jgi:uncharacterized protein with FMN-binding domain